MAKAAFRPGNHPLFALFENQAAGAGRLRFTYGWIGSRFGVTVSNAGQEKRIPIDWAFGAGVYAVTFLSKVDANRYLEHRVSYYPDTGRLDFTPGRAQLDFRDPTEAGGHYNDRAEAFRCIACHTTGTRIDSRNGNIVIGELGVRCEACHGSGRMHVEAARQQNLSEARKRIQNPQHYSAAQILAFCGNCHRLPPSDRAKVDWKDPANTRFQPVGLSQSRCYLTSVSLSCITCHDSHSNARHQDAQFYARICVGCHYQESKVANRRSKVENGKNVPARRCLRDQPSDCVACHMPRIQAFPHIVFSNHWIGVYSDSNKLVPVRGVGRARGR